MPRKSPGGMRPLIPGEVPMYVTSLCAGPYRAGTSGLSATGGATSATTKRMRLGPARKSRQATYRRAHTMAGASPGRASCLERPPATQSSPRLNGKTAP